MLSATAVRQASPGKRVRRLYDERGMYLEISPSGGKWWRLKYRFGGKEKRLSLGVYPDVSLAKARERREGARAVLADGIDPSEQRRQQQDKDAGVDSFETVAREWFAKQEPNWRKSHSSKIIRRLERDLFPWLGKRPVGAITPPELLKVLRRIEARGALETAHRALQNSGQVFRYAVATGQAERDPAADLRGALAPWKPKHYPSITDPDQVGALLRAIDGYTGSFIVRCALQLAPLVFVRPGELRQAEWSEFDLAGATWTIPKEKMKGGLSHIVPLSKQSLSILDEIQPLTGESRYVFPGRSGKSPISDNTVNKALRKLGYGRDQFTGHGFRAMARTLLDEVLQVRPELIEHQLAHSVRDPLGRAYNRTKHLPQRRKMMQQWADYLDSLKTQSPTG